MLQFFFITFRRFLTTFFYYKISTWSLLRKQLNCKGIFSSPFDVFFLTAQHHIRISRVFENPKKCLIRK